jgi:endonuclease G, mitochondrial
MGRIDLEDAVTTARRYAKALATQKEATEGSKGVESEAIGLNKRRDFMAASGRVFFESILEDSDLFPMRYLQVGQVAARAVGRIHLPPVDRQGDGYATGFLVAPDLLLTNHHVLKSADWARAATLTMDAEDGMDAIPLPPRVFKLEPGRIYVSDPELDFCFVGVAPRSVDGIPLSQYGYLRLFGATGKIARGEYATIVQHPNGRQKHIAIRNNKITVYVYDEDLPEGEAEAKAENNFLYYSTDTLKGSSGAPVFSDQWYVVALHRRGVPETKMVNGVEVIVRRNHKPAALDDPDEVINYTSNEGIRISRILAKLEKMAATREAAQASHAAAALALVTEAAGHVSDGPCSFSTATLPLPGRDGRTVVPVLETLEIVRRPLTTFPDNTGYDEDFLPGQHIPLPRPSTALLRELAPRIDHPDEVLLPFRHFTTVMHARRRLPVFAAVNIDGELKPRSMGQRPGWSYDPRIAPEHQPDDSLFSSMVQRGHMAARDYVVWGEDGDEIKEADVHSFTLTNVCPQIRAFNGVREWYEVEREVAGGAKAEKTRVTEFVGPILRADDPEYDDLRSSRSHAERGTGIRVPLKFWKIVAWVENGELKTKAFILDQEEELEEAGPLELDIETPEGVEETTVEEIARLTDLEFSGL